jgi:deazaflavin-dependent oxidoreductase (nitroreductase family)
VKRRVVIWVQRHLVNPVSRRLVLAGWLPRTALIETLGRRSGQLRITPVGNGLSDDEATFWIVAEHGSHASYIRNLEANPAVRIFAGGRWRSGHAQVLPDDDPRARLERIGNPSNAAAVRVMGTELLSVRVDLDPQA